MSYDFCIYINRSPKKITGAQIRVYELAGIF